MLVHSDGNNVDIRCHAEVYQTLAELKREGKILAYGLSGKTVEGGLLALQDGDCAMVTYNLNEQAERPVLDYAAASTKAILIKKALASGHACLRPGEDPVRRSLKLLFGHPGVGAGGDHRHHQPAAPDRQRAHRRRRTDGQLRPAWARLFPPPKAATAEFARRNRMPTVLLRKSPTAFKTLPLYVEANPDRLNYQSLGRPLNFGEVIERRRPVEVPNTHRFALELANLGISVRLTLDWQDREYWVLVRQQRLDRGDVVLKLISGYVPAHEELNLPLLTAIQEIAEECLLETPGRLAQAAASAIPGCQRRMKARCSTAKRRTSRSPR
ncbi:hypothetical protein SSTU70S_03678 [Stutzerimonas stutzeri]